MLMLITTPRIFKFWRADGIFDFLNEIFFETIQHKV